MRAFTTREARDYNGDQMGGWVRVTIFWAAALNAQPDRSPDAVLAQIQHRLRENFARLPDYVCVQTIERGERATPRGEFRLKDTIRLEVALIGNRERFAWPNASKFEDKDLRDMIGRGMVGTGNFALHAKHVFHPELAEFHALGEVAHQGRRALRYDYEVAWENSSYRIRVPPNEEIVGFRGSFLVDAETLDLLRLEVHADEIPPELGLDRAVNILEYTRVPIGASNYLLPKFSEMTMVALDGAESRNRIEITGCRQYLAESKLVLEEAPAAPPAVPDRTEDIPDAPDLPARRTIELSLESAIDLEKAAIGDPVRAVLVRPFKQDDRVMAPEGSLLLGRIVRLEKQAQPFDFYEIALQFDTLETGEKRYEFNATLENAGPASGLIRQVKRMNPTFTRRRKAKMDVLVREVQRGQGVLQWEARRPRIGKGFRMRWRVDEVRPASR